MISTDPNSYLSPLLALLSQFLQLLQVPFWIATLLKLLQDQSQLWKCQVTGQQNHEIGEPDLCQEVVEDVAAA